MVARMLIRSRTSDFVRTPISSKPDLGHDLRGGFRATFAHRATAGDHPRGGPAPAPSSLAGRTRGSHRQAQERT